MHPKKYLKRNLKFEKIGNKGGGLAMYIRKMIAFRTLEKLSNNSKHIESLCRNNKEKSEEYHFIVHLQTSKR